MYIEIVRLISCFASFSGCFQVEQTGFKINVNIVFSRFDFSMKNIINFRYVQNLANSLNRCACIIQFRDLHNQVIMKN